MFCEKRVIDICSEGIGVLNQELAETGNFVRGPVSQETERDHDNYTVCTYCINVFLWS